MGKYNRPEGTIEIDASELDELIRLTREYYLRVHRSDAHYPRTRNLFNRRAELVDRVEALIYGEETFKQKMFRHRMWRNSGGAP